MWPVETRNAETLLDLLRRCVFQGTTIMSDCWPAYINNRTGISLIEKLPKEFLHFAVNHSVNFVDPVTGAHTQTIESTWRKFKTMHKQEYGTHRSVFKSHVSDFVWRRKFGGNYIMFFYGHKLLTCIYVNK